MGLCASASDSGQKSDQSERTATVSSNTIGGLDASQDMSAAAAKQVVEVMRKPRRHWVGDGFHVYPVFADKAFTRDLSPFLMFDYASPEHFPPTKQKLGVGQHPHRGFETVTIAWQGEVEHGDHLGNRDVIHPGDVQWMTAARGIVHEEYHSREFAKTGGMFEMCQLWVNLPKKHKMDPARYQPISKDSIGVADLPNGAGSVRVIAGNFCGVTGPAVTMTPIDMWEILLPKADAAADLVFPPGHNTIVFIKRGKASVGAKGDKLSEQDVALMGEVGCSVPVRALVDETALLILSGEPINEPIASMGPFVMNTREELAQAQSDYMKGVNGFERRGR
eukprot:TRINITY_DN113070_c0_g1_i1.p1 TRINITY_DN113070_c0_g1~~TRINITY_DN113070_c0_g1_i1.p1  ORF type:complete len:335 (-),score=67.66 TRINITY_DN113070_c0_g1_i1:457-1461(-)